MIMNGKFSQLLSRFFINQHLYLLKISCSKTDNMSIKGKGFIFRKNAFLSNNYKPCWAKGT